VTDWATLAEVATAGGTLVLAVATFASVRSANRSARSADRAARVAEESLLAGLRPLIVNSRLQDPQQKVTFVEGKLLALPGGRAAFELTDDVAYMALSIRNVGSGLGVLHGWYVCPAAQRERAHPPLEDFTSQARDIFVAPGDVSFWQAAFRDPAAESFRLASAAIAAGTLITVYLLYGDFEGGQRVISQFNARQAGESWMAEVVRHFNVDRPEPR
jgi:hypothetical protein